MTARYEITIKDEVTYQVNASSEEDAVEQALGYWDERMPQLIVKKIPTNLDLERAKFIRQFDEYLRKTDDSEDVYDNIWLTIFPDEADEDEILELAMDNGAWLDLVQCFARCCRILGIIE